MINTEEAKAVIQEGATLAAARFGQYPLENYSLLEYLVLVRSLLDQAIENGAQQNVAMSTPERQFLFQIAAGTLLLAMQHHGTELYSTYRLRRSLHPQQAAQKSLLLENEFVGKEAVDVFRACYNAARSDGPFNTEDWQKLRLILHRLGLDV